MSRGAPMRRVGRSREDEKLRQQGYADAISGKEKQRQEPAYLIGYRGGLKRLESDA